MSALGRSKTFRRILIPLISSGSKKISFADRYPVLAEFAFEGISNHCIVRPALLDIPFSSSLTFYNSSIEWFKLSDQVFFFRSSMELKLLPVSPL
jgi:hypothetical protein